VLSGLLDAAREGSPRRERININTGRSASSVEEAVKKVGNARKRAEKQSLGR
jgi:hypothetical protein